MYIRTWDKKEPLKEGTIILYDGNVRSVIRRSGGRSDKEPILYKLSTIVIKGALQGTGWHFFAENADIKIIREPFIFEAYYKSHRYSLVILCILYEMFDFYIRTPILNLIRFISSKDEKRVWYSRAHYKMSLILYPFKMFIKRIKDRAISSLEEY